MEDSIAMPMTSKEVEMYADMSDRLMYPDEYKWIIAREQAAMKDEAQKHEAS
mgnify:CR=1 FL=1